jgi:hypothetical protein
MEIDSDVQPLLDSLQTTLTGIKDRVMPSFAILDEDLVTANYSADEQARLCLASSFALIMSYYSVKKLRNEPISEQLKLKVERVSEYVKKLREIVEREKVKRDLAAAAAAAASSTSVEPGVGSSAAARSGATGTKRPRDSVEPLPDSLPAFKQRPRVDKELVASLTAHVTGATNQKGRIPDAPSSSSSGSPAS